MGEQMNSNEEKELKTIVTKEQFYKLLEIYKPLKFIKQVNHYYVTNDHSHYLFRIRDKQGKRLFTRKEYIDGKTIEFEKYLTIAVEEDKEIIDYLKNKGMNPPFILLGDMTTYRAIYDNGLAELCFDINLYNGIIDYEIEYELKKEHDYYNEFIKILSKANIDYVASYGSKYKRFSLTKGE